MSGIRDRGEDWVGSGYCVSNLSRLVGLVGRCELAFVVDW